MRPVNLIPPEERRGERAADARRARSPTSSSAPWSPALIGVTAAGRHRQPDLRQQGGSRPARSAKTRRPKREAAALAAYTQFHSVREQRVATVTSLADSRFDWERVMRELSLVLPGDVWLTNLTGTASPAVSVEGGGGIALRGSIPGPALEMTGCAAEPGRGRRLRPGAEGHRRRHPGRRPVLEPAVGGEGGGIGGRAPATLPDARLHRPVPDRRRLRRGTGHRPKRQRGSAPAPGSGDRAKPAAASSEAEG